LKKKYYKGKINFEEFVAEMTNVPPEMRLEKEKTTVKKEIRFTPDQVKLYSDYFLQCDKDENGYLDKGIEYF